MREVEEATPGTLQMKTKSRGLVGREESHKETKKKVSIRGRWGENHIMVPTKKKGTQPRGLLKQRRR